MRGMSGGASSSGGPAAAARPFVTTRWSMVRAAAGTDAVRAGAALDYLCRMYWFPLYAFVRRQGHDPADAQDLTQSFFARLVEKRDLGGADPARARFRSYLLAAMKHFLANEWDKQQAQKRGGGRRNFTSLDADAAEQRLAREIADHRSADRLYEHSWALTLLDEVLRKTREAYVREDKERLFDALKPALTGDRDGLPYAELGRAVGLSEGAVKVAVHRLRRRYRDLLRAEIAATLSDPAEVDEELRHLFSVLSG